MIEKIEKGILGEADPLAVIENIRGQISVLGANDSEHFVLNEITEGLRLGEITPEVAVSRAEAVLNAKIER